jgi:D-glycero-alpha-D-manno-heptose 1-phosphate guanylyltransferase
MQDIADITAVILAGGKGTRLRPVVSGRPKVMAETAGRPFLEYLLDQLSSAGLRKAVVCCGYLAEQIEDYFGPSYKSLSLIYSTEDCPLGTGGAARLALPHISSDVVLIANGDSYIEVDIVEYVKWFIAKSCRAGLLLTEIEDASRYGKVRINERGIIECFEEKSSIPEAGLINAGMYLMRKELIASIPEGEFYSLEHQLFPRLAGAGLFGYRCDGRFIDIGTPWSYEMAQDFFAVKNP